MTSKVALHISQAIRCAVVDMDTEGVALLVVGYAWVPPYPLFNGEEGCKAGASISIVCRLVALLGGNRHRGRLLTVLLPDRPSQCFQPPSSEHLALPLNPFEFPRPFDTFDTWAFLTGVRNHLSAPQSYPMKAK